jgi:ParB/RepB/Spo0J family partition protein
MTKEPKIDKELTASKINDFFIPLDKIKIQNGFNVRKDFGDLLSLAKDIGARGLDYPLIVRYADDEKPVKSVVIIDGERRYRAIKLANEKNLGKNGAILEARCILESEGTDEAHRCYKMFSTGTNSKPLTDMEQAEVIYRLRTVYTKKPKEIALKIGRTQAYVMHLLDLHAAPHEIKEAVRTKKLSSTAAVKISKAMPEKRAKVMEKVRATKTGKKVKVAEVERITKGTPASISAKSIKDKIVHVEKLLEKSTEGSVISHWTDVKTGLEIALGISSLPPLE